ncbi:MAG: hypothetical protein ATN36_07995 [Epulopiscium sp. Nele67-Bin005]|nr:MAG: hypothetical protein ATN36_07995 [Epulopiscium sp. Nele67-Bin005]
MNKFDLFNEMSVEIDGEQEQNFTDLDRKRMKKGARHMINNGKNMSKNIRGCVAGAVVIALGMPVAGNYFSNNTQEMINVSKNLDDYIMSIGQSVTHNETTITLDEVLINGDSLMILTTIQTSENIGLNSFLSEDFVSFRPTVYIDGVLAYGRSVTGERYGENVIRELREYTPTQVLSRDITDNLNVKVVYNQFEIIDNQEQLNVDVPEWVFEFKTDDSTMIEDTVTYNINEQIVIDDGMVIEVFNINRNSISTKLYYDRVDKVGVGLTQSVEFEIIDNLGNYVSQPSASYSHTEGGVIRLETHIFDENGNFVETVGGIVDEAESLTITLIAINPKNDGQLDFRSEPIIVNLK